MRRTCVLAIAPLQRRRRWWRQQQLSFRRKPSNPMLVIKSNWKRTRQQTSQKRMPFTDTFEKYQFLCTIFDLVSTLKKTQTPRKKRTPVGLEVYFLTEPSSSPIYTCEQRRRWRDCAFKSKGSSKPPRWQWTLHIYSLAINTCPSTLP